MPPRAYNFEGLVIKRLNIGEADRILTIFTLQKGKINVLAKGVRKLSSKRAGSLELFNHIKASAVSGNRGLDTLTEVQLINSHSNWKKHLGRTGIAYELCEVIDKITPEHEPHPELFHHFMNYLSQIPVLNTDWRMELNRWLEDIISILGYWPKDKKFSGNIREFIENITDKRLYSSDFLSKIKG